MIAEKPSKIKIAFIIVLIISVFWFIGAIVLYFYYQPISEDSTTEYKVTINRIEPITGYYIITNEHQAKFMIFDEETVKDINALNDLSENQEITIRIKNIDVSILDNPDGVIMLVSLKNADTDIITLESYNENNAKLQVEVTSGFCLGGVLYLIISLILFLWYKKKSKNRAVIVEM